MEELSGRQFGPYRIIAPLGQGGMATIYRAFQPAVNRYVALKVLSRYFTTDAQFFDRFRHEAAILARFQHPHVLPVFDFGESDGYAYLVMPLVEGGTLASLMKGRPLALDFTERLIRQVGDALDYAHDKGIVHRDIKPSNILLDERGNSLLADFGVARMTEGATRLTMTGMLIGTPQYMSPEQASGEKAGPASDIYSLGIVLYEMVTGRVPFTAETPVAVAIKHIGAPLPLPRSSNPTLTPEIEGVILKALARSPGDRFHSAGAFASAFSAAVATFQSLQERETIVAPTSFPTSDISLTKSGTGAATNPEHDEAIDPAQHQRIPEPARYVVAAIAIAASLVLFFGYQLFSPSRKNALDTNGRTTGIVGIQAPSPPEPQVPRKDATPAAPVGKAPGIGAAGTAIRKRLPEVTPAQNGQAIDRSPSETHWAPSAVGPAATLLAKANAATAVTNDRMIVGTWEERDVLKEDNLVEIAPNASGSGFVIKAASDSRYHHPGDVTAQFDRAQGQHQFAGRHLWSGLKETSTMRWGSDGGLVIDLINTDTIRVTYLDSRYTGGWTYHRVPSTGPPGSTDSRATKAAAPEPASGPVRVGGSIKQPTKTKDVRPLYPQDAQAARVQGVVIIEATIGPTGTVQRATILRSIPMLDAAALDAVRQWEFTSTLLNGVPVPVIMTVTVNFTLQ